MSDQERFYYVPLQPYFVELQAECARLMGLGWPDCPYEGGIGAWSFWRNPLTGRGVWTSTYTGRVRAHKEMR